MQAPSHARPTSICLLPLLCESLPLHSNHLAVLGMAQVELMETGCVLGPPLPWGLQQRQSMARDHKFPAPSNGADLRADLTLGPSAGSQLCPIGAQASPVLSSASQLPFHEPHGFGFFICE